MDIGIIGAGFIGGTLARKLASAGHSVRIANSKDPSTLSEFTELDGITPAWAAEAVSGVDVAILSVPLKAIDALSQDVVSALTSVPVVIDTGNYYPVRDGHIDALDQGMTDSEWVASRLGRPVYKAFNNIGAPSLKHKGTDDPAQRLGLTIAGPAGQGKQTVGSLITQLGFDPVDVGDLEQSWRVQPGTPTYCKDMTAEEMKTGIAKTSYEDIGQHRQERDQLQDFDGAMKQLREYM
jgi:8-hydroxy-5-deazaflavin:NADPH oxidoreductase